MPEEFPLTFLIVQLASGELSQLLFSGKKKRRTSFCLHFWSIEFQVDSYLFHPAPTPIFKDVAPLPLGKHSFRKQVCCYFYLYPVCIILLFFLWILLRSTLCHGYIGLWFWCVFRCFTFCLFCMSFDEIFGYVKNMRFLSVWEKKINAYFFKYLWFAIFFSGTTIIHVLDDFMMVSMVLINMLPCHEHILIFGICEYLPYMAKGILQVWLC